MGRGGNTSACSAGSRTATTGAAARQARRLESLLSEWGIDKSYDSTDPRRPYAAILHAIVDGEANAASSFTSLRDASEWLADGYDSSNPREPAVVVDLATGQRFTPHTSMMVTLNPYPGATTPGVTPEERLNNLLAEWGIDESCDSTDPKQQYAAVLAAVADGETNAASSFSSLEAASDYLACGYDSSNPREPAVVLDLNTGQRFTPRASFEVTLTA
jgi:hypothetical protein